ncbi:MAG TPA: CCA tRNA nucleotidyltransferase [Phycisphaerae bacterium]|nr:CCA tRNA nucleotidyltransferase [Phycisphaerae bacterium]
MPPMADAAARSTALRVVRLLRKEGFQALLAGGCVRDMLLGRRSTDYDVATDATPRQVKKLFGHVLLVGAKFGVAVVIRGKQKVEVATFRSDLSYSDGRRPDGVRFSSPREDALRRDFTINGMFYDPVADEVIDYVGGRKDLAAGVVRTIGRADERFAEDYLRMLRAVRFAVRLGFRIAPATAAAVRRHAGKIVGISGERIYDELSKMLSGPSAAKALRRMEQLHLAAAVLPELFGDEALWPAAVARVEIVAARKDLVLTLAALLAELPGVRIDAVVRRGGASNELREALKWLGGHLGDWRLVATLPLPGFRRLAGSDHFERLRALWRAQERIETGGRGCDRAVRRRLKEIPDGIALPEPFVKGSDLLAMGLAEGPELGRLLWEAYDAQLGLGLRTPAEARAWARRRSSGR